MNMAINRDAARRFRAIWISDIHLGTCGCQAELLLDFLKRIASDTLAEHIADADVFVFPSRTDTYGLVLLEALASGVPVAAYPVRRPIDVVNGRATGVPE